MKERAKQRMKRQAARFVVGYIGAGNILFGGKSPYAYCVSAGGETKAIPMTLKQAQRRLATIPFAGCAIFELVPVEVNH